MIKVTENGVPLSAVVSVEFREPRIPVRSMIHDEQLVTRSEARMLRDFYSAQLGPPLRLPMTEAEACRLRDEWAKAWSEADRWLNTKWRGVVVEPSVK